MDGTLPKQLKVKLIFVNEVWRCLREARPGFEQRETVLSQQMLLVLLHTHTLWCSPITLDLLWRAHSSLCMVLSSSSRGSCVLLQTPCHHRASSIKVAALWSQLCHWASKTGPFWGAFAVYCDKVVLSQTKYTVQGTQCTVGNPFTEKTIVLRAKGRPWENDCSIWELAPNAGALNQWISHFVCVSVWKWLECMGAWKRKAKERDYLTALTESCESLLFVFRHQPCDWMIHSSGDMADLQHVPKMKMSY